MSHKDAHMTAKIPTNEHGRLPLYNVVLLKGDGHHTLEFIIAMLQFVFNHPERYCRELAGKLNTDEKVVVCLTHREEAELKHDQILEFGRNQSFPHCHGSMSVLIEPVK